MHTTTITIHALLTACLLACDVPQTDTSEGSTTSAYASEGSGEESTLVMGETSAPGLTETADDTSTSGTDSTGVAVTTSATVLDSSTGPTSGASDGGSTGDPSSGCGDGQVDFMEECDGGDRCFKCLRDRVVFLAGAKFTPIQFGSVEGADAVCSKLAAEGGLLGEFKAWLATPVYSPATHFKIAAGRYIRTDNIVIAESWGALTSGTLDAPVTLDANGKEYGAVAVWTSTATNGEWAGDFACSDWTANSGIATWGGAPFTDARWTQFGEVVECYHELSIYCFEQG